MGIEYRIRYHKFVKSKDIPALDGPVKKKLRSIIENKLLVDPLRFGKPLQYALAGERSLRVGSYRILYDVDDQGLISVWHIGLRSKAYPTMEKRLKSGWN